MQVVFAYPLPSIPIRSQPILIQNPINPTRIHVTRGEGVEGWILVTKVTGICLDMASLLASNSAPSGSKHRLLKTTSCPRASNKIWYVSNQDGLELISKDMRTQPTSQNSIPTSQNLDFGTFVLYLCVHVFWKPKSCFSNYTWKMFNGSRLYRCGSNK